jgi:hypothetical protein
MRVVLQVATNVHFCPKAPRSARKSLEVLEAVPTAGGTAYSASAFPASQQRLRLRVVFVVVSPRRPLAQSPQIQWCPTAGGTAYSAFRLPSTLRPFWHPGRSFPAPGGR